MVICLVANESVPCRITASYPCPRREYQYIYIYLYLYASDMVKGKGKKKVHSHFSMSCKGFVAGIDTAVLLASGGAPKRLFCFPLSCTQWLHEIAYRTTKDST
jgi:hypothetical protein